MDRVHYRRVAPSRIKGGERGTARANYDSAEPTAFENIILQCIVSGILGVVVLLISLADIAPAVTLRDALRQTLSGAETPAELIADVREIGGELFGAGIGFGASPETEPQLFAPQSETAPQTFYDFPIPFLFPEHVPEYPHPTAEGEISNPQIPGPSAVPELWD